MKNTLYNEFGRNKFVQLLRILKNIINRQGIKKHGSLEINQSPNNFLVVPIFKRDGNELIPCNGFQVIDCWNATGRTNLSQYETL